MAKDYSKWTQDELIAEIKNLQKRKKFGVVWENQPEQVARDCKDKLPVLQQVKELEISTDPDKPINYLIEGDNYHSLSVLNYTHKSKVDVIYIDPPYNTGNRSWKYNNNYIESEDSYRHSKWLSFMNKRLRLAKNLLKPSGVIVATIDDYEVANLILLMDEIFGEFNRLGVVTIVQFPGGKPDKNISATHEYALFYALDKQQCKTYDIPLTEEELKKMRTQRNDGTSFYTNRPLRKGGPDSTPKERPNLYYPIFCNKETMEIQVEKREGKNWVELLPIDTDGTTRVWRLSKQTLMERAKTEIVVKKTKDGEIGIYTKERKKEGKRAKTVWTDSRYAAGKYGTMLLRDLLGEHGAFDYPKSVYAVLDTLHVCCGGKKDAVVLDFFAGSGTTGHAVALLNKQDGGNRQFILCTNNENGIARDVCYARIKAITQKNKPLPDITGIDLNLKYLTTDFVSAELTDASKYELSKKAVDMLCLRENTSKNIVSDFDYQIFKNHDKYIGIVFEDSAIEAFKKEVKKIKGKILIYRFSLTNDYFDERFDDLDNMKELLTIHEGIMQTYRKIFRGQDMENVIDLNIDYGEE